MLELFIWLLATIGLTNILVHGKIFDDDHLGWRNKLKTRLGKYGDVLDCYECMGWWSGLITGAVYVLYTLLWNMPSFAEMTWWFSILVGGTITLFSMFWVILLAFAGAAVMHAYIITINFVESKTDFVIGDIDEPADHNEQQDADK